MGPITTCHAMPVDFVPVRRAPLAFGPVPSDGSRTEEATPVQGVIKSYDPSTGDGVVVRDTDLSEYDLAADALEGSILRMLRQGQRVVFDLDDNGQASSLRLGSEAESASTGPTGVAVWSNAVQVSTKTIPWVHYPSVIRDDADGGRRVVGIRTACCPDTRRSAASEGVGLTLRGRLELSGRE